MKSTHSTANPGRELNSPQGIDANALIAAATQAVHEALARHKARGESVVIWRDGHIVTLRPEEIDIQFFCAAGVTSCGDGEARL